MMIDLMPFLCSASVASMICVQYCSERSPSGQVLGLRSEQPCHPATARQNPMSLRALLEQVKRGFQVLNAQWAEIVIGPSSVL